MPNGTTIELRCDTCRMRDIYAGGWGRADLVGSLYVPPNRSWMSWSGQYWRRRGNDVEAKPGPRQFRRPRDQYVERIVPESGIRHRCRRGHRMQATEAELWDLLRRLPMDRDVIYLPAA